MTAGLRRHERDLHERIARLPEAARAELMERLRGAQAPPRESWWVCHRRRPAATCRLFCFSYAGGGPSVFRPWADAMPQDVEVRTAQLPGRAARVAEPAYRRMEPLVLELQRAIEPHLDMPFAFFGHSMGALIAFELTRRLRAAEAPLPTTLLLAAFRAPQLPNPNIKIHHLPDEVLKTVLLKEGTPRQVVDDDALMRAALPTLRADLELCDTYRYNAEPPLEVPMSVFGGDQDARVSAADLGQWRAQAGATFRLTTLPGSHFFIHSAQDLLLAQVSRELETVRSRGRKLS
ncbi:thioesterase II family protein [Nocardia sp. NPDC051321]|uniref:thioesterase II family protein n=1 Tax=Nocardia sp. NPDC051321 TaxID=3364323 RepID=UPI0037AB4F1C